MKKRTIFKLALFFLLTLFNLSSCVNNDINEGNENDDEEIKLVTQVNKSSTDRGRFIDNIEVIPSSEMYKSENLVNDTGMEGSEGYFHYHSSLLPRDNMFITRANKEDNYVILKLNEARSIGYIDIWNYNHETRIDCSVKEFKVSISLDNENYFYLNNGDTYTLEKYSGTNNETSSLINNSFYDLDLGGLTAQYIKFDFISNYGGNAYGLSEIRVYEYKNVAKKGNILTSNIFIDKNSALIPESYNLINYSGMNEVSSLNGLHSNNKEDMYISNNNEIIFSFNGKYPLDKLYIYNYNDEENLDNGVKDLSIYYSIDGINYSLLDNYVLNKASGENNISYTDMIELNNISVQYIKFIFNSNFEDTSFYGLSEVIFTLGSGWVSEFNQEYTFLHSSYNGWSGSDGVFNTRINGNQSILESEEEIYKYESIFNYSDTYIGNVEEETKDRKNSVIVNNSFGLYKDKQIDFLIEDYEPLTPIKDSSRSKADAFYWLGDSFVIDNYYYVHALYIAKEGVLGFAQKGEDLIRFDIKDGTIDLNSRHLIKDENTDKLSYFEKDGSLDIIFGAAIFENVSSSNRVNPDGYIYNFGYKDDRKNNLPRSLVVSRVKEEDVEDFSKYEYYDGTSWSNNIKDSKGIVDNVSCEMSVVEINDKNNEDYGKFILTFQEYTTGNNIIMIKSDTLFDNYEDEMIIYTIEDKLLLDDINYYNAKMHPTLSTYEKLIFSYNLNEASLGVNNLNADIYRPRFYSLFKV